MESTTRATFITLSFTHLNSFDAMLIFRAVNRTVYGYGRTPYGKYTASDRTVF